MKLDKSSKKDPIKQFQNQKITASLWIGGISVITIAIFGFAGYIIDMQLGSKPFGMIIAILVSFPISQIIIYRKVKRELLK